MDLPAAIRRILLASLLVKKPQPYKTCFLKGTNNVLKIAAKVQLQAGYAEVGRDFFSAEVPRSGQGQAFVVSAVRNASGEGFELIPGHSCRRQQKH